VTEARVRNKKKKTANLKQKINKKIKEKVKDKNNNKTK
tara:strand:+ start:293 stop:406 length:114 start_codon:yes stop_codon:yes gene_type:complete